MSREIKHFASFSTTKKIFNIAGIYDTIEQVRVKGFFNNIKNMKKIILVGLLLSVIPFFAFAQDADKNDFNNSREKEKELNLTKKRILYSPELDKSIVVFPTVCYPKRENQGLRKVLGSNDYGWAKKVLDIGTGSGILGFIVLKNGAKNVVGTDINPAAVKNANHNAKVLGYANVFKARLVPKSRPQAYSVIGKDEKFDLIISALPWIEAKPANMADYSRFDEGRVLLRSLIEGLRSHLAENGKALISVSGQSVISLVFELASKYHLKATIVGRGLPATDGSSDFVTEECVIELTVI